MNGWERLMAAACVSVAFTVEATRGGTVTWDDGGEDNLWSTGANWSGTPDNTEPTAADDASFPANDTITLSAGETASNLTFGGTVTLTLGDLTLSGGGVDVAATKIATIISTLAGTNGLSKTGTGLLNLGGANRFVGGFAIAASGGTVRPTLSTALGNNPLSIGAGGKLDVTGLAALNYVHMREFGGAGEVGSAYQRGMVLNSLNDGSFTGTMSGASGNGQTFVKAGPGTLTIGNTILYLGARNSQYNAFWRGSVVFGGSAGSAQWSDLNPGLILYDGTLVFDDLAGEADRVEDTFGLYARGRGTVQYRGNTTAEALATLYLGGGGRGAALDVEVNPAGGGTATLTFAAYSSLNNHSGGAEAANFRSATGTLGTDAKVLFTTAPGEANNVIPLGFAQDADFATYDPSAGVIPFGSAGSGTTYLNPTTDLNAAGNTDTVLIDANTSDTQLEAADTWNALKIDGARTLDLNGFVLTVGENSPVMPAMLLKTGNGDALIEDSAGAGYLFSEDMVNRRRDYSIRVNEGLLRLTARVNMLDISHFGKSGPGVLWIDPSVLWLNISTSYGEGIYFSEGVIRLDPRAANLGGASAIPMYLCGGVMELTGGGTYRQRDPGRDALVVHGRLRGLRRRCDVQPGHHLECHQPHPRRRGAAVELDHRRQEDHPVRHAEPGHRCGQDVPARDRGGRQSQQHHGRGRDQRPDYQRHHGGRGRHADLHLSPGQDGRGHVDPEPYGQQLQRGDLCQGRHTSGQRPTRRTGQHHRRPEPRLLRRDPDERRRIGRVRNDHAQRAFRGRQRDGSECGRGEPTDSRWRGRIGWLAGPYGRGRPFDADELHVADRDGRHHRHVRHGARGVRHHVTRRRGRRRQ